jgi:AraC-like DNA-binding protein
MQSFFQILILLGSLQGFIISCLLFASKKNRRTTRILSVLLFLISLASFNLYAGYSNWFGSDSLRLIAEFVPMVFVMPVGPLMYFYIKASLDPDFKITKKQYRHFLPVIVDLVPSFITITILIAYLTHQLKSNPSHWGIFIDDYNVYADIPRWVSLSFYLWLSYKYINAYKLDHGLAQKALPAITRSLSLFVKLFLVFQCIWLVYLIPYVIPRYTNRVLTMFDWYPVYIPLTILIYWLGIKGYIISQQDHFSKRTVHSSSLTPETIQNTANSLKTAMEMEQLYLNPNLNLKMISDHTGIAQKTISAVLNQGLLTSFNEFVNGYRVEKFKKMINQPGKDQLTIAGIAFECGFNSQATFQRTFKQVTGMSPTEFKDSAVNTIL